MIMYMGERQQITDFKKNGLVTPECGKVLQNMLLLVS